MTDETSDVHKSTSTGSEYYICYKVMDAANVQDPTRFGNVESAKRRLKQINESSVLEDAEIRDQQGSVVADWREIKKLL